LELLLNGGRFGFGSNRDDPQSERPRLRGQEAASR